MKPSFTTKEGLKVYCEFSEEWDDDIPMAVLEEATLEQADGSLVDISDKIGDYVDVEALERAHEETMNYGEYLVCRAEYYADCLQDR